MKSSAMQQLTAHPNLRPPIYCSDSYSRFTSSPALTLSPRYVNSLTMSTSSHNFTPCYTASPIFPSCFLHTRFLENIGVTIFTPAHLQWIYLPHCTHKTKLAFALKLQTPHGSILLLDMSSFVMLWFTKR